MWNRRVHYQNRGYFGLVSFETIYVKRESKKNAALAEEAVTNIKKVCQRVTSSTVQENSPWPRALQSVDTHKLKKLLLIIASLYNINTHAFKTELIFSLLASIISFSLTIFYFFKVNFFVIIHAFQTVMVE